jgi:hypothetical protein
MAIYGNKTTMSGEVNPNNFATRPGVFPNTHPAPSHDYLFGSNMGLPELENNLSISKARIKSVLPYPLNFGAYPGVGALYGPLFVAGFIFFVGRYTYDETDSVLASVAMGGMAGLAMLSLSEGGRLK